MKKGLSILLTTTLLLLGTACSSSDSDKKSFVLNINGTDYHYNVTASYHNGDTPDDDNKYVEIYGHSSDTNEFSACMIGFSYKVEGSGIYTMTDYYTMSEDIHTETGNKYIFVHVNLGNDEIEVAGDQNIIRYGTTNNSGTIEVKIINGEYRFKIDRPLILVPTGESSGNPPANAPESIIISTTEEYM
ncbi:hypothetical protein [Dysgonomonas sp. 25]|uniref:hypothetical protein n=1 Tax=Dysgonomonas sp. 25 TaxID=2302933 RepID=UPI0013D85C75|nr:hypothetical protein [Dysgonomonas sp. 25]NDV70065.1 hypothetical protein [Dysgonomonas sp. 25]